MSSTAGIERHFARCAGLRLHWREAGAPSSPPLVLLHPSPRSSGMFEPWMTALAADFRVLAPDTPGYGASDRLPEPPDELQDYVPALEAWRQHVLGRQACGIYGSATGAQLGIAWALSRPEAVAHLFLDNVAHFDDAEREFILASYFPDLSPRVGGAHLLDAWRMAEQTLQYFPWFAADEAHRISNRSPSPEEVHATMMDFLATGPDWASAYRAAFRHERAENVQRLSVPTTLFRWEASILLRHIDRLLGFAMPPQLDVVVTPAPLDRRYAAMTEHLRRTLRADAR